MIESYLEQASTYAANIDNLFSLIFYLVGFWFVVCEGIIFWLCFKFKAKKGVKSQYITGELKQEKKWISIPHYLVLVCDIFIIVGAVKVWVDIKQHQPEADRTVRVIGQQWAWSFVHPGADGQLDTKDDIKTVDELHIEAGKVYHYELQARDVMHSFSVPVFRLKQDAIPGRTITGWFEALPDKTGVSDIQCAEMCGMGHGIMSAKIFIETPEQHAAWIKKASGGAQVASAL